MRLRELSNRQALDFRQLHDWQHHGSVSLALIYQQDSPSFPPTFEISPRQEACCSIGAVPFHAIVCEAYPTGKRCVELRQLPTARSPGAVNSP